ncbi:hypothetical protein F3W80_25350 [Vibrio parahaemolyticus]|nr:hypothetical protein [Vibrio parahaemolyticus]EHJ9962229.1 hypothetical protein [Vibrio parahaemolyticus]EHK0040538.1 hypothetical protein [Vibrio parahaemolyticus]EIU7737250.1 hypothetical protein [Vibrio parahaemolyticus]HAS6903151.1 hypothetical protein [Vibrio parahaemolyticus]
MSLGGKNGLRKLGLCGTHPLTQRYVLRRKLENWCNYKLGSNPGRERRLMWEY